MLAAHARSSLAGALDSLMGNGGISLRLLDYLVQLLGIIRDRPLLHVRILADKSHEDHVGGLRFEIENRRRNPTSLDPEIVVTYHSNDGERWSRGRCKYYVRELDRGLVPFVPKILTASIDTLPRDYWLSWFRTYRFRPTSGVTNRLRVRNTLLDQLSFWRFVYEFVMLRVMGRVIDAGGAGSYEEWQRKKRARGPH